MDSFKDEASNKLKFKQPAYKLRPDDNLLSWKFLMNLPGLDENNATQIGSLFDMLGMVDDSDLDMSPMKPWMDMMSLSFNETYCILLYLWFILDVELPLAPYPFIGIKQKVKKEKKQKMEKKIKSPPKPMKKQQKKQNIKKKQKAKAVSLADFYKMDGM